MTILQFENLSVFVEHVVLVEECEEKKSTVIHLVSGIVRVVDVPYKEVLKRMYSRTTGATFR